jgi:hypothetical protein
LFLETSYLTDFGEMLIYLNKSGYAVEAFSVSESVAINNFGYIKKLLKQKDKKEEKKK